MLYPLTFQPIFKERLWGSRTLETLYGKELPANLPIGESWEIVDRPGDISMIDRGPLAGTDLHALFRADPTRFVDRPAANGRFPLLIKILDAREKLSLQVHPPPGKAAALRGEPKTEMWFLTQADPGAELYVGLQRGLTRKTFEEKLRLGTVAECFHRVPVQAGDAMFVPSGRVHAVGAGAVLFEVQQNSDTTYRVFDWNRTGPHGQARALHIAESLESIDFNDFEPDLVRSEFAGADSYKSRPLVSCPYFKVDQCRLSPGPRRALDGRMVILGIVSGVLEVSYGDDRLELEPGRFCLVPARLEKPVWVGTASGCELLLIEAR